LTTGFVIILELEVASIGDAQDAVALKVRVKRNHVFLRFHNATNSATSDSAVVAKNVASFPVISNSIIRITLIF
jgi:hypothetical protein